MFAKHLGDPIKKDSLRSAKALCWEGKRPYELQRLHFQDNGSRNSISGVRATVFGGTSVVGLGIGQMLTDMGSINIYPHRYLGQMWDNRFRELKVTADLGNKTAIKLGDFTDEREINHSFKDSNVVISCIGSKKFYMKDSEFEEANIIVPRTIAKAAAANPNIKRFIYISAAGADPNSASRMLRTKWLGEQEVKEHFPEVTILRPTQIIDLLHITQTMPGK
jgi:NADH dehydrogenase (ubiquinone) 1 alpha subcomplex subunit 9